MVTNEDVSTAMTIKLDGKLPSMPEFVEGIRRAPDRGFRLSKEQARTALTVSYTHLDVYKRQVHYYIQFSIAY